MEAGSQCPWPPGGQRGLVDLGVQRRNLAGGCTPERGKRLSGGPLDYAWISRRAPREECYLRAGTGETESACDALTAPEWSGGGSSGPEEEEEGGGGRKRKRKRELNYKPERERARGLAAAQPQRNPMYTLCRLTRTWLTLALVISPGCDEYVGSGRVVDKCGVCGGDNTSCRLVSGLYRHSLSKIGYHKIVEIPEGATKINSVGHESHSLRSRAGRSIINGNWAIDRPGRYEGAGTMFTYRRPNEITTTVGESFVAEGPTNEILDVYMIYQQPNPGVHYEYILPSESPGSPAHPDHSPDVMLPLAPGGLHRWNLVVRDLAPPSGWVVALLLRVAVVIVATALPVDCVPWVDWDIGEWSECSKTCGLGMQHRQVLCRQVYANRTLNVHTSRCRHLEQPETASTCQTKICSEWQIRSDCYSHQMSLEICSVPCGLGQRSREVRCVSNIGDFVPDEECNMNLQPSAAENFLCLTNHLSSLPLEGCGHERPADSQVCNNGPCENSIEWFTGPWSQRAVVCLMKADEGYSAVPPYECSSLDRPLGQQSCHLKACGAKWYHTDWSACSKTCEEGFRLREVRCLADDMLSSDGCEELDRPPDREPCNPEPCTALIDDKCRDKYFNCNVVVQARLCVYDYYKTTCCTSCSRVAHRQSVQQRGRS
ncbi:hypothetical protein CRUP_025586 [Coryphaenoides rupestris]|nr:hypothetical protein CRUP_025586 [Coryphaenoides rupestris]